MTKRERVGESPEYYISTLNDRHFDMCMAIAKPTARQIKLMSPFDAAIKGDKNIKRKSIVSIVRARDGLNLQNYRHKINRAKEAVVEEMEGEWSMSFPLLAPHLVELRRANPASAVALEVDQDNRFFRYFVSFGVCISSQSYNVPVVGFDGTHLR